MILRPDAYQDIHLAPLGRFDVHGGKIAVIGKGSTRRRPVAVDDVAALVTAVALEPDPPAILEFGGPEAISRNQAIAVAERATGRPMKHQHMPAVAAPLGMRLLARRNDALASVLGAGLHQDRVEARWDDAPLRQRGIAARSATEFIQEQARFPQEQARG